MSLDIRWFGPITEKHPRWKALNGHQKKLLIPDLPLTDYGIPWMLLAVGMNVITDTSIPIIVSRLRVIMPEAHFDNLLIRWSHACGQPVFHMEQILETYRGVSLNIGRKSDTEFIRQVLEVKPLLPTAERKIDAEWRKMSAEFLKAQE